MTVLTEINFLVGLGMGIIGALLPLTLFSGEEQTAELITEAAEISVVMLIVLSITKLFATSLLLATGWKGGYIFPILFASVALGSGGESLVPCNSSGGGSYHVRTVDYGFKSTFVYSALFIGPGAERNRGGDCRCGGHQRLDDRFVGAAYRPACEQLTTKCSGGDS